MPQRQLVSSESDYEQPVGFSRAVRVGAWVSVAGTTAVKVGGGAVGGDDIGAQTHEALTRIEAALKEVGARLDHVVRTRMFVTDIDRWEEVGAVHGQFFGTIRPATSMVEVSRLIRLRTPGGNRSRRHHLIGIAATFDLGCFGVDLRHLCVASVRRWDMHQLFAGFDTVEVRVDEAMIHARVGGSGPPVLLLHGYPQTHVIWQALST